MEIKNYQAPVFCEIHFLLELCSKHHRPLLTFVPSTEIIVQTAASIFMLLFCCVLYYINNLYIIKWKTKLNMEKMADQKMETRTNKKKSIKC